MRVVVRLRSAAVVVSVLAAVVMAGCSQTEAGSVSPGPDNSVSASSEPSGSAPAMPSGSNSETSGNGPVQPVNPCSLLTRDELSRFDDFGEPEESTQQGDPVCTWAVAKESATDVEAPIVNVVHWQNLGVADVVDLGGGIQPGRTDTTGREVARTTGVNEVTETPICMIAMAIGDSSRLDVQVGRTAEPCDLADQLVEIIDPKLPWG
ncbi:DUF3558 family protein [Saccharomonospora viridis]|uniref:DUF3558 family protein n=1 Tax=Saccharomonospora viridis TaxID=1852 RepID=UPI0008EBC991|nr:DUF3558 family protein [Saccharomonospora viridis]SFP19004.1 Protein of unknown function [Saccharomonospora viridis]